MKFTLNYWLDDGWFVGKLIEIPGVFSQGETLDELIENIKEVYNLMVEENKDNLSYSSNSNLLELVIWNGGIC